MKCSFINWENTFQFNEYRWQFSKFTNDSTLALGVLCRIFYVCLLFQSLLKLDATNWISTSKIHAKNIIVEMTATKLNRKDIGRIKTAVRTMWLLCKMLCSGLRYKSNGINTPFFISNIHLDIGSIPFRLEFGIHNGLKMYGAAATVNAVASALWTHSHCNTNEQIKT